MSTLTARLGTPGETSTQRSAPLLLSTWTIIGFSSNLRYNTDDECIAARATSLEKRFQSNLLESTQLVAPRTIQMCRGRKEVSACCSRGQVGATEREPSGRDAKIMRLCEVTAGEC
jgi:hypothetical protein